MICLSSIYLLYVLFLKNEKCNQNSWLFPATGKLDRCVFMGYLFPNICSRVDSKLFDLETEYKSLQAQVELRFVLNLCLKYPKASYEKFLSMHQIKTNLTVMEVGDEIGPQLTMSISVISVTDFYLINGGHSSFFPL